MNEHVADLLDRARRLLRTARALVADDAESAVNRAYYAAFNAARAGVLAEGETPKSHAGVQRRFFDLYVRSGRLSKEQSHMLSHAEDLRLQADYAFGTRLDAEEAAALVDEVESFVAAIEALLRT
jgi:uncharacterized protein (UPF0332 family)